MLPLAALVLLAPPPFAELRVVDAATGRGVPLVELETVDAVTHVTDNAGRVALPMEPGFAGRTLFFSVRAPGYEIPKDGFGVAGVKLAPDPARPAVVRLKRVQPAERLCRLTGEGPWRDSALLGHAVPPPNNGRVAGQDSVQTALYRGKRLWLWGDTQRLEYPLGLYRMPGATTPAELPDPADVGIAYDYFVDPKSGFARATMPLPERPEGVIWIDALTVVPDASGRETLLARYSRRKGLTDEYEAGVARWIDEKAVFEPAKALAVGPDWRRPASHPTFWDDGGRRFVLYGAPSPNVRCPATAAAVLDPSAYEALTCLGPGGAAAGPLRGSDGRVAWRWQSELPPVGAEQEEAWVKEGKLKLSEARFLQSGPAGEAVRPHSGSVAWNGYRKCWLLAFGRIGGKESLLGEAWLAEGESPCGPFRRARLVASHPGQTFYNVVHHPFLDRDGGRVVHFEGTYTNDFSGNPRRTPRYNYNQVMYRVDLGAE